MELYGNMISQNGNGVLNNPKWELYGIDHGCVMIFLPFSRKPTKR
jgi:hypothetical protein